VAHLQAADPSVPDDPAPGPIEDDQGDRDLFAVEAIVGKKIRYGKPEYLVKWEGYGNDRNSWRKLKDLEFCLEMVKEYDLQQERVGEARAVGAEARPIARPQRQRKRRTAWEAEPEVPGRR